MTRLFKFSYFVIFFTLIASCENSSEKQLSSEASGFLLRSSNIIANSLRYSGVKTFPQRSYSGMQELDKLVAIYLNSIKEETEVDNRLSGNNKALSVSGFPKMYFSKFSKSGFLKSESTDKDFTFVVLWRQSENSLWSMKSILVAIDGKKLSKLDTKTTREINSEWIDKNLIDFPNK